MKVVYIDHNFHVKQLEELLEENKDCKFIHYKHEFSLKENENLMTEERRNNNSCSLLFAMANRGFYQYMTKENRFSSFVQHDELPFLWKKISTGEAYFNEDGVVYSFDAKKLKPNKLLVVFSSVNSPIYKPHLDRMFTKNFSSIGKYVAEDTMIMRIADLGGVTGSYYLNSKYLPFNENNIQKLIKEIQFKNKIKKVVLLGASKGGSAALYHGMKGGYDFVAVDPIVTDDYYFKKFNDLHFMRNVCMISKQESFEKLLIDHDWQSTKINRVLITSKKSPQYEYLSKILFDKYLGNFSVYINSDPAIKDHPDVSPKSLMTTTSLVNKCLEDIPVKKEVLSFMDTPVHS